MTIETARLLLIPATADLVALEISSPNAFGQALSAEIPENWPPETVVDTLPWFLEQLKADPDLSDWSTWYGLCRQNTGLLPILVGSGGFFGRPVDQTVEVGYSVLPQFQGQGYATEIVEGLITRAFSHPMVSRVVDETTPDNLASLRVLEKLGFTSAGTGRDEGSVRFERMG